MVQVVAFTYTLADSGENGVTAVLARDVTDEFLDEHCLANASTAEKTDFAAFDKGGEQIDRFDAGLEEFGFRALVYELRRILVYGEALRAFSHRPLAIDRLADDIEHSAERR